MVISAEVKLANAARFLDEASKRLGIKTWEDWYQVSYGSLVKLNEGSRHLAHFSSPRKLITSVYPQYPWNNLRFSTKRPRNFWNDSANRLRVIQNLTKVLKIKEWEDWYRVSHKDIIAVGAQGLLGRKDRSLSKLIASLLPDYPWDARKFKTYRPDNYWQKESSKRDFLDSLSKKLKFSSWTDWYKISAEDLYAHGGRSLLKMYSGSPSKLVMSVYPQHSWNLFRFTSAPKNFWADKKNRLDFIETLGKDMNIKRYQDWYRVTKADIFRSGGKSLVENYFSGSSYKLIMTILPNNPWQPFLFRTKSFEWTREHAQSFLSALALHQHIESIQAWRTISPMQIIMLKGGHSLLTKCGSLQGALR